MTCPIFAHEYLSDDMAIETPRGIYVSWRVHWLLGSAEPAVCRAAQKLVKRVVRMAVDSVFPVPREPATAP